MRLNCRCESIDPYQESVKLRNNRTYLIGNRRLTGMTSDFRPMRNTKVAVIMLTMNQREKTLRALGSFRAITQPRFDLLLWDNGSADGTADAVRREFPEVLVHRHPTNLGVAGGRNAAAALAMEKFDPTHLLFIDNDMVVTPNFVGALLAPFAADDRLAQTQAKLRFLNDPLRLNDGGGCRIRFWLGETRPVGFGEIDQGQYDKPAKCISCGGAMMVRTDVFRQLGGFDERFNPFGPEDLDFSLRAYKQGYHALYVPDAVAYHEVSHSFEGGEYTELYARNKARLWLLFMRRHASVTEKIGFLFVGAPYRIACAVMREGRKGNWKALRGALRGLFDFWKRRRPHPHRP
jgi:GT2 family glycosyltransferase